MRESSVVRKPKSNKSFKHVIDQKPPQDLPKPERFVQSGQVKPLDPLSDQLGQKAYQFKKRFGWLKREVLGVKYALDIERFYEPLNLCIDIKHGDHGDVQFTELKKELCEANGLKYFYLKTGDDVEAMLKEIEAA
jgi:hypothetical protein